MHLIVASSIGYLDREDCSASSTPILLIHFFHRYPLIGVKTIAAKVLQGAPHAPLELDVATRMLGAFHTIQAHVTTDMDLLNDAYQTVFSEPRFLTACCHVLGAFLILLVLCCMCLHYAPLSLLAAAP